MILDLVRPTSGTGTSKHIDVAKSEGWKTYTGSFLDESFLIDYLTPDEYFEFLGSLHEYSDGILKEFHKLGLKPYSMAKLLGRRSISETCQKGNQKN